jgi:predicted DNA-binding protein (MmcQ/YjbR family)
MDVASLRGICLEFPGAFEDFPFGPETAVFKVRAAVSGGARHEAKMFALSAMNEDEFSVSLKCDPVLAEQLRAAHPEITGAWHLNKTHWNGVRLDGALPDSMIRDMVEDSYDLVVATLSRRQQEQLGWSRLARETGGQGPDRQDPDRQNPGSRSRERRGRA